MTTQGRKSISAAPVPPDRDYTTVFEGHHRGLRSHIQGIAEATIGAPPEAPSDRRQWRADALAALAQLRNFAEVHFADEEKLMEDVAYPGTGRHAEEHRSFLADLERLQEIIDAADLLDRETMERLATWWERHSTDFDADLASFLCRGGI